jgi:hypothetical protein
LTKIEGIKEKSVIHIGEESKNSESLIYEWTKIKQDWSRQVSRTVQRGYILYTVKNNWRDLSKVEGFLFNRKKKV